MECWMHIPHQVVYLNILLIFEIALTRSTLIVLEVAVAIAIRLVGQQIKRSDLHRKLGQLCHWLGFRYCWLHARYCHCPKWEWPRQTCGQHLCVWGETFWIEIRTIISNYLTHRKRQVRINILRTANSTQLTSSHTSTRPMHQHKRYPKNIGERNA